MVKETKCIYLHIGLFKTATKFLQQNVFPFMNPYLYLRRREYEKDLLKRMLFSDYIAFRRELGDIRNAFSKLMGENRNVILSHELFSGNPMFQSFDRYVLLMKIKDLFPGAKIIIGIRGQRYMIDSLYREYIVQGGIKTFEEFTFNRASLPKSILDYDPHLDLTTLRYGDYLDCICETFGRNNIFIFPYEKLQANSELFVGELCQFMNVDPASCHFKQEKAHESLGDLQLRILRIMSFSYRSAFNHRGLLPYKFHPRNYLRLTNRIHYKRKLKRWDLPDYSEDNDYIDKKYSLSLRNDYNWAYF